VRIRLLGAIGAVLLALVGATLLFGYVRGADERARAGLETKDVLVVSDAIPAGTSIEEIGGSISTMAVPLTVLAEGAVTELSEYGGRVTSVDLLPGEQVLAGRLVNPEDLVSPGTIPVPEGLQEVSVLLSPDRVLGGRLQAGDTVGIIASFEGDGDSPGTSGVMLHKVLVTSVQGALATTEETDAAEVSPSGPAVPEGSVYVTFALTTGDTERVIFAAEFGRIWLTNEPAEATEDGAQIRDLGGIFP
jgi:pilus assembly protein CpaB